MINEQEFDFASPESQQEANEAERAYECFFKKSRYRKEKLVTIQLHDTMHKKLLLVKKIRGVTMTDFLENVLEDWFNRHGKELAEDLNKLERLI